MWVNRCKTPAYYRNNVAGTLTLLEAMREYRVDKFIFSSTCATYGFPESIPVREDHPQCPIKPYSVSKLMIERMLQDFNVAHWLRSISLRYFNATGADPDDETGESHDPETHLIPLVLDVSPGKRPVITIFGNDYDIPDGIFIRDYIHVSDFANAHILALKALEGEARVKSYNLGNGLGFSVKEVIATRKIVIRKKLSKEISQMRPGDPACLVGNAELAKQELNWKPRFVGLSKILSTAWK